MNVRLCDLISSHVFITLLKFINSSRVLRISVHLFDEHIPSVPIHCLMLFGFNMAYSDAISSGISHSLYFEFLPVIVSRLNSDSIVSDYGLDDRPIKVRSPAEAK
jgi:hypothetical protein